ncbi:MAG TPA: isoprenylcysteine carboxylmethyltransferase family protein [Burkholderiales bacterium]
MATAREFRARGGWWVAAQALVLLAALVLAPATRAAAGFDRAAQFLGVLLVLGGVALAAAGLRALGSALSPYPRPRADAELVTRGAYRYVRHPIYSGIVLAVFGWALAWLSVPGLVFGVAVALFFDRKAAREEAWLCERYPEYAAYARRVRRFVPGVY